MGNACARPVIIPAPDGPAAKPIIDEKELANRAARLATELFGPLEDSVVAQLDELVKPEYLKQISVPDAVASQLSSESKAQEREREARNAQRSAEQARKEAEAACTSAERERERAQVAAQRAKEQVAKAQKEAAAARAEADAARSEADAAREECGVLRGKLAEAEGQLAKIAAAQPHGEDGFAGANP